MAKDVTLADIAAKVGVSNVAVSKALSGKQGVSEELRNKIKDIAKEMGYVSNVSAKVTISETGNIGVIIPENYYEDTISFYGCFYKKIVRALYENNYYGILELLTKEDEKAVNMPKVMQDEKVDGLIFLGQLDKEYIEKMAKQTDLPVFFLDTYVPFVEFDTIISNGYYGAYQLTNYLIEHGHRKIGFVGSVDATSSIADRYWGYRHSLRENKIESPVSLKGLISELIFFLVLIFSFLFFSFLFSSPSTNRLRFGFFREASGFVGGEGRGGSGRGLEGGAPGRAVEVAVGDGFGYVGGFYGGAVVEVGYGAGYAEDAVVGAG